MDTTRFSPKALRRLTTAEGYLDLEMPQHALAELDSLDDYGPFEAPMHFLRGQALKAQERFDEAIPPLKRAVQLIPAPHNRQAWLSLSECFRHQGRIALADALQNFADASSQSHAAPLFNLTIEIDPVDLGETEVRSQDDDDTPDFDDEQPDDDLLHGDPDTD